MAKIKNGKSASVGQDAVQMTLSYTTAGSGNCNWLWKTVCQLR